MLQLPKQVLQPSEEERQKRNESMQLVLYREPRSLRLPVLLDGVARGRLDSRSKGTSGSSVDASSSPGAGAGAGAFGGGSEPQSVVNGTWIEGEGATHTGPVGSGNANYPPDYGSGSGYGDDDAMDIDTMS